MRAFPVVLVLGVLPACGGDPGVVEVEMRNHAGAAYSFTVSAITYPELSDYDLIPLSPGTVLGRIEDGKTKPFEISVPQDFKAVTISRVEFSVSVRDTDAASEPLVFPVAMAVGDGVEPWLDYVVRDGVFDMVQGEN
jgi:hypothetical protein